MLLIPPETDIGFRNDIIENSILGIETPVKMGECLGTK